MQNNPRRFKIVTEFVIFKCKGFVLQNLYQNKVGGEVTKNMEGEFS